mgnify:CR=1 FL=1
MKPMVLGCIADDFTGATDLANNLVRGGMRVASGTMPIAFWRAKRRSRSTSQPAWKTASRGREKTATRPPPWPSLSR